jgi:hypothetical protein
MKKVVEQKLEPKKQVVIEPPNFKRVVATIIGDAPYVQHKFSEKSRKQIMDKQALGSVGTKGKKKEPRDFDLMYHDAMYISTEGWNGIPASCFRNAMVSACKIVGFHMSKGKLAIFVEADGYDANGTPLVKITKGEPHRHDDYGRIYNGNIDVNVRPMWKPGWEANVRIRFDADMFSQEDIANLLARAGMQVGVGEGRPDSKDSCGCGWGTFMLKGKET